MLTGRMFRALAAGTAVLCLAACTGNSSTDSTTVSPAASSGAAPTGTGASATGASGTTQPSGSGTAQAAGLDPTYVDGKLTSVPGLPQTALDVINQPLYKNGQWAIAVRDIDTGEQLVALNADTFFEPGSVVKTYSTGAAWLELGPDSTVVTPVKRTGEVVDGTLNGDLILVGKGDVTMGGRTKADGTVDFANLDHNDANGIPGATLTSEDPMTGLNDLAAQVKASGITAVSGDVIVDDRLWEPHKLAGNVVSPIQINQNVIDFTTTPTTPGQLATTVMNQQVAPWQVSGQVQTVEAGGKTQLKWQLPGSRTGGVVRHHRGRLRTRGECLPAHGPGHLCPHRVHRSTRPGRRHRHRGSVATNPAGALPATSAVDGLTSVAELTSLPLSEEATYINKISYNNGGETMLCRLAVANGSTDCTDGPGRAGEIWRAAGLDTTTSTIVDGSGLIGNVITPNNQVDLQTHHGRPSRRSSLEGDPAHPRGRRFAGDCAGERAGRRQGRRQDRHLGGRRSVQQQPVPDFGQGARRLTFETKGGRNLAFAVFSSNSFAPTVEGVFAANDDVGAIVAAIQQSY